MTTHHRADRHRSQRFAQLLLGLLIVAAAGYTASFPVAAASSAEPEPPPTTLAPDEEQGIIPQPNSGHEPREAGDRGGALQLLVLTVIVGGVGGIGALVVRESRRNLASRNP